MPIIPLIGTQDRAGLFTSMLKDEPLIRSPRGHGYPPRTLEQVIDMLLNERRKIDPITGCWIDRGTMASRNGYTKLFYNRKWIYTTRFMWEIHTGNPPPKDMFVCHKCDNPPCFNPDHLFLGTNYDNMQDMIRKGRARHLSGDIISKKIRSGDVIQIRQEYAAGGTSQGILGRKFGVSKTHVRNIIHHRKWKDVK